MSWDTSCTAAEKLNYAGGLFGYPTAIFDNKGICASGVTAANIGVGGISGWLGYRKGRQRRAEGQPMFNWFSGFSSSMSSTTLAALAVVAWLFLTPSDSDGDEEEDATPSFGGVFEGFSAMMANPKRAIEKDYVMMAGLGMGTVCYMGGVYYGYQSVRDPIL